MWFVHPACFVICRKEESSIKWDINPRLQMKRIEGACILVNHSHIDG